MLMVVWMHCVNNLPKVPELDLISRFIGIMYMPCFFLISGYFLKDESYKTFLFKKIKTLVRPLFFVYILSYIFAFIISCFYPELLKNGVDFWNLFLSKIFTNGPIWFLAALFASLNVVYFIRRLPNKLVRWIIALSVCAIGFYWRHFFEWRLPLFFDTGLTAVVFVFMGSYIRKIMNKINNVWILWCLVVVCYIYTLFLGVGCSMQNNTYSDNLLEFIFSAISGSAVVLSLSKCIKKSSLLQYIGRNSLIVLCFHMFVLMGINFVIKKFVHNDFFALLICFTVTTIVTISIIPVIKKTLYFVFK